MKKISLRLSIAFIIGISLTNCDKINDGERYCGNWSFVTYYKDDPGGPPQARIFDTTFCEGKIIRGPGKRELIVYYHPSKYKVITVESDGKILNTEWGVSDYCGGEFDGRNKFKFINKYGNLTHRYEEIIYGER
jgi:hypothetical protein